MTDPLCAVVAADPAAWDLGRAAEFVAAAQGIPLFDAKGKAKHLWGFLAEKIARPEAEKISALAAERGIPNRIIEESGRAVVPPPNSRARQSRLSAENLSLSFAGSVTMTIPFPDIRLVALCALKEDSTTTQIVKEGPSGTERFARIAITLTTGIPLGFGKTKEIKKEIHKTDFFVYMDIFTGDPIKRGRINPQEFDFGLPESQRYMDGLSKLKIFFTSLLKAAPNLRQNQGARKIAQGQPWGAISYESARDYEKELQWMLSLP